MFVWHSISVHISLRSLAKIGFILILSENCAKRGGCALVSCIRNSIFGKKEFYILASGQGHSGAINYDLVLSRELGNKNREDEMSIRMGLVHYEKVMILMNFFEY